MKNANILLTGIYEIISIIGAGIGFIGLVFYLSGHMNVMYSKAGLIITLF